MKKLFCVFLILTLIISTLSACSKKTEETVSNVTISLDNVSIEQRVDSEPVSSEVIDKNLPLPERKAGAMDPNTGLYMNPFTGAFDIEKEDLGKRPYAIMINNIKEALPQWGISSPDVCYEFIVEGGITRILAIFADVDDIPKMGPVRSARTYYVNTVAGYDAMYVHYGASDSGKALIKSLDVTDVDGMTIGNVAKRDPERSKIRATEHTVYTTGEWLKAAAERKNFRTNSNINDFAAFSFVNEGEDITVNGSTKDANKINIVFSEYTNSCFEYNSADGLYYKSEYGKPQVDANNDKQIAVKNVILIKDKHTYEPENGICLILGQKAGSGYLFSDGKVVDIKWTKGDSFTPYAYTLSDGTPLKLNPGQTWISVIRDDAKSSVTF